jgi:outer membrane protein assembly factor BamB
MRTLAALLLCTTVLRAADWPQWLGPTRDGVSTEKVKPWKEPPTVVWRYPAGEGNSSPVVAAGRVFLHSKVEGKTEEEIVARDAATGKELWRQSYPRRKFDSLFGNGPRATPAVSAGKLYSYGMTGVLACWETETGKRLWQVDALTTFGVDNLKFGVSCSPLVEDSRVLLNVGAKGASIVAFDRDTGKVVWKTQDDGASYSSPIVFGEGKQRQVVFLTARGVVSVGPKDGELFWRFPLVDALLESSTTPARAGDMLLASSITYGSAGLRLGVKDGKPAMSELWKNAKLTSYFSTPVAVGAEHIYLVTGSNPITSFGRVQADLQCLEAKTGKVLWTKNKIGRYHASLIRTGDDKLLLLDDNGNLVLLEPSPREYRELARAKVCGETWAHPALANGRLYVRDEKDVICLQLGE